MNLPNKKIFSKSWLTKSVSSNKDSSITKKQHLHLNSLAGRSNKKTCWKHSLWPLLFGGSKHPKADSWGCCYVLPCTCLAMICYISGGVFQCVFWCSPPKFLKFLWLTHIFQMTWNHQVGYFLTNKNSPPFPEVLKAREEEDAKPQEVDEKGKNVNQPMVNWWFRLLVWIFGDPWKWKGLGFLGVARFESQSTSLAIVEWRKVEQKSSKASFRIPRSPKNGCFMSSWRFFEGKIASWGAGG